MAEAVAPPQAVNAEPSFLERIGSFLIEKGIEKGILAKGIPVDDGTRTVQGAVAPSSAPVPSVVAAPVAKPVVTGATLAPMVTEKDRAAAEAAKADGSQKALLQAASQADTEDAQKALALRANNAAKGQEIYDNTLKKVTDAGGLQTPDGRVAYAQLWQNKDNAPQYANAFMQYLMGNTKAAKSYLSGGAVTDKVQIDSTTGDAIKYGVDENGDYHWAINQTTGKQLTPEEFGKVVGRLSTLENSIAYQQQKANAEAWTARFNTDVDNAVTTGAAAPVLGGSYKELGEAITGMKDINPAFASELSKFASSTIGTSAAQSKAAQALKQRIDSGSLTVGTKVSAELAASIGASIPGLAGATFKGNGVFETSEGNKIDINQLSQGMATANSTAEMEKKFTANAKDLLTDAKIQALMAQDPSGNLYKRYKAAIDLAQSIAMQEAKVGSNAFNLPTIAFGVTDDFSRARIQAEQGMFNQKANAAYADYARKMAKTFGPGQAPRPGELLAGFTASDQYKSLLGEYKNNANRILKETPEYAPKPAGAGISQEAAAVVPPKELAVGPNVLQQFGTGDNSIASQLATQKAAKGKPEGSAAPPAEKKGAPSLDEIAAKHRK
jgi:hypothetical protein